MTKTALITGITGQDGAYLARFLLGKGYRVVGGHRRSSSLDVSRLRALGIGVDYDELDDDLEVELKPLEMLEPGNVRRLIEEVEPHEVYNMAAQTFVATSFEQPEYTVSVNALGTLHLLEAIRNVSPAIRYYQASTSEMFGNAPAPQNELTPFSPRSPYGVAKLAAHWLTVNYREAYGIHASSGILFNHESPLRGPEFVTQKIAQGLVRIKYGERLPLLLGNLDAKRDWGFAEDYVNAMWRMLQKDAGDDYVIATGSTCTVRGFVGLVAKALGIFLEWSGEGLQERALWKGDTIIRISEKHYRPTEVDVLCGDASKAGRELNWQPTIGLPALAAMMAEAAFDKESERRSTLG